MAKKNTNNQKKKKRSSSNSANNSKRVINQRQNRRGAANRAARQHTKKQTGAYPTRRQQSSGKGLVIAGRQQTVLRSEPYSKVAGRIMDRWRSTRIPMGVVSAWNSDHIIYRKACIDITGGVNGSVTTAQIEDFTGVDAAGSGGDRDKLYAAMVAAADHDLRKDWVDLQVAYFLEKVPYAVDFIVNLAYQALFRTKGAQLTESDTSGIWTEETWNSFLASTETKKLKIPLLAYNIAQALCVYWVNAPPIDARNIKEEIFIPFQPVLTVANARVLRSAIKMRSVGSLHASKTKLPEIEITQDMIRNLCRQIKRGTDEHLFWMVHMVWKGKKGAGSVAYCDELGLAPAVAVRTTNGTTSYTSRFVNWIGDTAHDNWALIDAMLYPYNSSYNKTGALIIPDPSDDEASFASFGQNDVAATVLTYESDLSAVIKNSIPMLNMCKYDDGSNTDDQNANTLGLFSGYEVYMKTGLSKDDWDSFEGDAFQLYFKDKYNATGENDAVPAAK